MKYLYFRKIITRRQKYDYLSRVCVEKKPAEERVVSLLLDEYPQTHDKVIVVVHSTFHTVFS